MIIKAKPSRQQSEVADPREQLEFNAPEKRSKVPIYFGLLIVGIAAYLKSVFPALSQREQDHRGLDGGDTLSAPRGDRAEPGQQPKTDDVTTGSIDNNEHDPSTVGGSLNWPSGFASPDPSALNFTASFELFGPQMAPMFPAAFTINPRNDNTTPPPPTAVRPVAPPETDGGDKPASLPTPPDSDQEDEEEEEEEEDDDNNNGEANSVNDTPDDEEDDEEDEDEDDNDEDEEPTHNRAPITAGPVRLHDVFAGEVVLIGLSQLLFGATDPDGDMLTINDITATGGTLVQISSGWSFATAPEMQGVMTFTYDISDGLIEVVQTATIDVVRNAIQLVPHDDVLVGTPQDDDIDGLAGDNIVQDSRDDEQLFGGPGDDIIFGGDGNDIIDGGAGDDTLFGEEGDDIIHGGAGSDILMGGAGDDILNGGADDDHLYGGEGDDILLGGTGDDVADGGAGDDLIDGGAGDDVVEGGEGDDALFGGPGDDTLRGGSGNDVLAGGDGIDLILSGSGDDEIDAGAGDDIIVGDAGCDQIDGGDGYDTLDYSSSLSALYIDMVAGTATGDEIDEDFFQHIEEVIGGGGGDTFAIGMTAMVVSGGGGNDLFVFTITDEWPTLSHQLAHQILDFVVGDRIHVADYEISGRAEALEEERFEEFYDPDEGGFEAGLPIRVTYAFYDDMDHTIIEADVDRDDTYEISIILDGVQPSLNIDSYLA